MIGSFDVYLRRSTCVLAKSMFCLAAFLFRGVTLNCVVVDCSAEGVGLGLTRTSLCCH